MADPTPAEKAAAEKAKEVAKGAPETTAEQDAKAVKAAATTTKPVPVAVVGRPGGPFTIDGTGFGNAMGSVSISGRTVEITRWKDTSIKGMLPADLAPGDVVVKSVSGELKGKWPPDPPAAVGTVTVKTPDGKLVQGELVR